MSPSEEWVYPTAAGATVATAVVVAGATVANAEAAAGAAAVWSCCHW